MITARQCAALLRAERSRDRVALLASVHAIMAADRGATLLDIETAFRDAGTTTYLVWTTEGFVIRYGMPAMLAECKSLGITPADNRMALALRRKSKDAAATVLSDE